MANTGNKWALVKNTGETVLDIDSFIEGTAKFDGSVVFELTEQASFSSYNKTAAPNELPLVLGFEGSDARLSSVLDTLEKLRDGTDLFSVVTPTKEYENMTLERFDFNMSRESGYGVLYANCVFFEVKESTVEYSKYDPSDYDTVNTGSSTTRTPTAKEEKEVEKSRRKSAAKKIGDWF